MLSSLQLVESRGRVCLTVFALSILSNTFKAHRFPTSAAGYEFQSTSPMRQTSAPLHFSLHTQTALSRLA